MMLVRPARMADLPALERFALESGVGVTSLPNDRERLFDRIRRSIESFAAEVDHHGEEVYLFILEEDGEVQGTAALVASAGIDEPFYNYRNETLVHASPSLKVNNRVHALTMCHDLTGETQLGGFHVTPAARNGAAAELLSRARLMYVASHRSRFSNCFISEMLGWSDENDQSPFWDEIGRRFFHMDYAEAVHLISVKSKTFVAELMPTYPIYVPLLSDAAQQVIGQIHPEAEVPFSILIAEGFEADNYLDIFDGGPVLTAKAGEIRTIADSRVARVDIEPVLPVASSLYLLSNQQSTDFITTLAPAWVREHKVWLTPDVAEALQVGPGDGIRVIPFLAGRRDAA